MNKKLLNEAYEQQHGNVIMQYHERRGWYLLWPDGFVSAMPNEAAAKLCCKVLGGQIAST